MEDGVEDNVAEVSTGELLLEKACWVFEKDGKRDAVLRVCEYESEEAGGADLLAENECVKVKSLSKEKTAFWNEDLEMTGSLRN